MVMRFTHIVDLWPLLDSLGILLDELARLPYLVLLLVVQGRSCSRLTILAQNVTFEFVHELRDGWVFLVAEARVVCGAHSVEFWIMKGCHGGCEGSRVIILEPGLHRLVLQSHDGLPSLRATLLQLFELIFRVVRWNRGASVLLFDFGAHLVLSSTSPLKALISLRFGSLILFASQLWFHQHWRLRCLRFYLTEVWSSFLFLVKHVCGQVNG